MMYVIIIVMLLYYLLLFLVLVLFILPKIKKKGQTFGVPKFGRMFECCAPEILFLSVLQRVESKNDRQAKSFIAKLAPVHSTLLTPLLVIGAT
jgi:hypothetical protein